MYFSTEWFSWAINEIQTNTDKDTNSNLKNNDLLTFISNGTD